MKKPELLLPANNPEVFRVAVNFGADAVYIGGEAFSLRAKAKNFTLPQMEESISFAHARGVKVYVTANILAHNKDIEEAEEYFRRLSAVGPDALLISDPGLYRIAQRVCPQIERHISTQANNVNYETFLFWHELGAKRVVCGRELSLEEIREIRNHIPDELEIEAFVHGAMCISYSGRCLLSNYLTGRDANHGECTHPCRWKYAVMEETRPGEYMPVEENERGTYIFNSKDLCMVEHIPDLAAAGIDSLKVEGRMKTALYVATAARTYRKAIDDFFTDPELYQQNMDWYRTQIEGCTYRRFTTGFFYGKPSQEDQIYDSNTYIQGYVYLGIAGDTAVENGMQPEAFRALAEPSGNPADASRYFCLEQRNKFSVGEMIEIMKPDGRNITAEVLDIRDEEGSIMPSAPHPQQKLFVRLSEKPAKGDLLRRKNPGA